MQQSFTECNVELREGSYGDGEETGFRYEVECVHEKTTILDGFSLQYNAIVYTLQRVCGFRVRSFLLYDKDLKNKRIFMYLTLSAENRLRLATKYQIKK